MSETRLPRHPLFDATSTYSRMRNSVRPEHKMPGYFHWLKARAIRLGIPLPGREEHRLLDLCNLTCRLVGEHGQDLHVTDAVDVSPVFLHRGPRFRQSGAGSLVLVREADGTRTVGMRLELDEREPTPSRSCRAFLIEPEVLTRLQEVVQKARGVEPDHALDHAFAGETIASNVDVARLLSAIPDLDGEVRHHEIRFHRLPIANEFDTFPPRQGALTVVLVLDDPMVFEQAE